jgi:hypothetical protein
MAKQVLAGGLASLCPDGSIIVVAIPEGLEFRPARNEVVRSVRLLCASGLVALLVLREKRGHHRSWQDTPQKSVMSPFPPEIRAARARCAGRQ